MSIGLIDLTILKIEVKKLLDYFRSRNMTMGEMNIISQKLLNINQAEITMKTMNTINKLEGDKYSKM